MMLDWNKYHKERELDMTLHAIGPDVSSSGAAQTAEDIKPTESLGLAAGDALWIVRSGTTVG